MDLRLETPGVGGDPDATSGRGGSAEALKFGMFSSLAYLPLSAFISYTSNHHGPCSYGTIAMPLKGDVHSGGGFERSLLPASRMMMVLCGARVLFHGLSLIDHLVFSLVIPVLDVLCLSTCLLVCHTVLGHFSLRDFVPACSMYLGVVFLYHNVYGLARIRNGRHRWTRLRIIVPALLLLVFGVWTQPFYLLVRVYSQFGAPPTGVVYSVCIFLTRDLLKITEIHGVGSVHEYSVRLLSVLLEIGGLVLLSYSCSVDV